MTDFAELNKLFLKRNNIYREYLLQLLGTGNKESFEYTCEKLFDDVKDDLATWDETLRNNNFQVPAIVEKTWDNLYKNMCNVINVSANIKTLKGF